MDEAVRSRDRLAWLQEAATGAAFRLGPYRPARGLGALHGDGYPVTLTLHLENLRTLQGKLPPSPFYYEVWLVSSEGRLASAGAFNAGGGGLAGAVFHLSADELAQASVPLDEVVGILVTAQPNDANPVPGTPVLEGLLQPRPTTAAQVQPPARTAAPPATPPPAAVPQPEPAPEPVVAAWAAHPAAPPVPEPESDPASVAVAYAFASPPEPERRAQPVAPLPEAPVPDPAPALAQVEAEAPAPAFALTAADTAGLPAAPAPDTHTPPAPPIAAAARAEAPTPAAPRSEAPAPTATFSPAAAAGPILRAQAVLSGSNPLVSGVQAVAQLDFGSGGILLTLRGMPAPSRFGNAATTGREYNVYKAWLVASRSRDQHSLGILSRIWHDTYRIQVREGVDLRRFDAIQITAEDRSSPAVVSGPVVLNGRYASLVGSGR